jgi:hypothetical protein
MTRWLRNRANGVIYEWDSILAKNPKCEEVTEEIAFPERFLTQSHRDRLVRFAEPVPEPEELDAAVAQLIEATAEVPTVVKATRKGRKRKGIDLHTDDIPEEPGYSNPDIDDEATRRLG